MRHTQRLHSYTHKLVYHRQENQNIISISKRLNSDKQEGDKVLL